MMNKYKRDTEHAARVMKTARIAGVSVRYVRMVLDADRENERVLSIYMELLEKEKYTETALVSAVKNLIPFN